MVGCQHLAKQDEVATAWHHRSDSLAAAAWASLSTVLPCELGRLPHMACHRRLLSEAGVALTSQLGSAGALQM